MCLALPFRLTEIDGLDAVAERDGIKRNIRLDFIKNPKVGDYVLVHAGFAIERLKQDQAEENLEAAAELYAAVMEMTECGQK